MSKHILVKAEDYFKALDKNHDGFIDRSEIRAALENVGVPVSLAMVSVVLKECDFNNDGKISLDEFKKFSIKQDEKLRELFNAFDKDNTGDLSVKDIKSAL